MSSFYVMPFLNGSNLTETQIQNSINNNARKINKCLKVIAKKLKLDCTQLVFKMARHTFAQILYENDTSYPVIQKMMGHSKITTTSNYLGSLPVKVFEEAASILSLDF